MADQGRSRHRDEELDDANEFEGPRDDEWTDEEDLVGPRRRLPTPRLRRGARTGSQETLRSLIRDIPKFGKLLWRLARDPRVSKVDKAILLGVLAYMVSPVDVVPDIPFVGQIDDIYLLALALSRLLNRAGIEVLLDHWDGEVSSLEAALGGLEKATSFLPDRVRTLVGAAPR